MKLNKVLVLIAIVAFTWSCKKDDSGDDATAVPPRLLSEVAIEDDAKIKEYLETHFYNYEEFDNASVDFDYQVVIDTIAGDNAGKTSLSNSPELHSEEITVDSDDFGLSEKENDIKHTLYYLVANKGNNDQGAQPTAMDSTYITYEGIRLDNTVFDQADVPLWFDLVSTVRGFGKGVAGLKSGGAVDESAGDGTFKVLDPGTGIIFIPSGLAYFSGLQTGGAYAPIIFKVNLLRVEESDHDRDGVPTWKEDIDGDSNPKNDDTDEDGGPNYLDVDDDGDFISTNDEIRNSDGEITIPYPGSENNGTPNYLDKDKS